MPARARPHAMLPPSSAAPGVHRALLVLVAGLALAPLSACNSILGIKDLSDGDAGPDGDGPDPNAVQIRFLLVAPHVHDADPSDPSLAIHLPGGEKLVDATYGTVTPPVELPMPFDPAEGFELVSAVATFNRAVSFDRAPVAGERVTAIIAGRDDASTVIVGINEALFTDQAPDVAVRVVHAISDVTTTTGFGFSQAGVSTDVLAFLSFGEASTTQTVAADAPFRLRVGPAVATEPGTEEVSFSVLDQGPGSRVLFVLGGSQHHHLAGDEQALTLHVIPVEDTPSRVRQDPALFVVNALADHDGSLALTDDNDGTVLSSTATSRSDPMVMFVPADVGQRVGTSPDLFSFDVPALQPGTRQYVALIGHVNPVGGQPPAGATFAEVSEDSSFSTNWSLVQGSSDPSDVSIELGRSGTFTQAVASLSFGQVHSSGISDGANVDAIRISPSGGAPLAALGTSLDGRRWIVTLYNRGGSSLELHRTNLDAWPWR